MTKRDEIRMLRDEIAELRAELAGVKVQVAQAGAQAHHHIHYPPPPVTPSRPIYTSPTLVPFSMPYPNTCQMLEQRS